MKKGILLILIVLVFSCAQPTVNLLRARGIRGPHAPRVEKNRVVFSLYAPEATLVSVVGDFNGWNPEATMMEKNEQGVWTCLLVLGRGYRYAYKFVIDGFWVADPENPLVVSDGYGGYNSLVEVP